MAGIYIHVPFCIQACSYCDFYFSTNHQQLSRFVEALEREIATVPDFLAELPIETVYFGGGTPSVLSPEYLDRILQALDKRFPRLDSQETTLELNPEHGSEAYLTALASLGVTRLSVGIQSFKPKFLSFMNRAHSAETAHRVLERASDIFPNAFSADIIFGLPDQSEGALLEDISDMLSHNPSHVSAYTLTVEEKTRLWQWVERGVISLPDDHHLGVLMNTLEQALAQAGLLRYEISNFAVPGRESRHNSSYWNYVPYIGFGPSSHSFYQNQEGNWVRSWKQKNIARYVGAASWAALRDLEVLSEEDHYTEYLMLRLRTQKGLDVEELQLRFGKGLNRQQEAFLEQSLTEKWVKKTPTGWALTGSGMNISESILSSLLSKA